MLHIQLIQALELVGLGLVVGAVSPTFGIGGGLLTVPLLVLIYGMSTTAATATSLGVIIFVSLSGTIAYIREKRIDFRVGFLFIICAVPGSVAGGLVSNWLKSLNVRIDLLQILFAATMLTIAAFRIVSLFRRRPKQAAADGAGEVSSRAQRSSLTFERQFTDRSGTSFVYTARMFPGMIIAFAGGFVGAMLGLGGGVIYVPILTALIGLPAGIATATSTFTILFANPFAVAVRFASIQWNLVLFLSIGVVVSATIVPRFLHRIKATWLLAGFWTLAILASVRLLLKVLGVSL